MSDICENTEPEFPKVTLNVPPPPLEWLASEEIDAADDALLREWAWTSAAITQPLLPADSWAQDNPGIFPEIRAQRGGIRYAGSVYTPPAPSEGYFRGEEVFKEPLQVTTEEAAVVRRFVDALKPGLYLKCAGCERFYSPSTIHFNDDRYLCDRCG